MSKRLQKYASSSDLMDIQIFYGDERFKFNLYEEVVIDENKIESEIKDQPTSYSFLAMLRTKLKRALADAEFEQNKTYGRLFNQHKSKIDRNSGRVPGDDTVVARVYTEEDYEGVSEKVRDLQHKVNIIDTCVRSFEQRKDLIQTLSANLRKEQH